MPTRSGHANLYTLEMTPAEGSVTLINHITGARCVLLHRVRGLFSTIDRSRLSRDICHLRWQICKDCQNLSKLQLFFNSAKGDSTTGLIRSENAQLSGFLTKKRGTEEAALIKAGLCSTASAEHGTSSETSLRTWLAHHVRRRALLPAGPPPSLSAELLCIGKDCSGKRPGGVDSANFMGLFIPSSLSLSGTLI